MLTLQQPYCLRSCHLLFDGKGGYNQFGGRTIAAPHNNPKVHKMNIDAARFAAAMSVDAYMAQMWENRDIFAENYAAAVIDDDDLAWFAAHGPFKVLALVEDWCADTFTQLPPLAKLAAQVGAAALEVRVLYHDDNPDLAAAYLQYGYRRTTPVFVFFDAAMNECGRFFERASVFAHALNAAQIEFVVAHPEYANPAPERATEAKDKIAEVRREYRRQHRREAAQTMFAELRELLGEGQPTGQAASGLFNGQTEATEG